MATRLSDVAARVNLSPALISRVLNNRPGVWASEETRQRIFDAARELGYRPSAAARSLRSGKTHTVAFVFALPAPNREIIEVFSEQLSHAGYQLLVQAFPDHDQVLAQLSEIARARVCDAAILWGSDAQVIEQGRLLEEFGLPFVAKGRFADSYPHWPQVDMHHEDMMAQAVAHLVERGHRRIGYMGYVAQDPFPQYLMRGFQEALAQHGIPFDPDLTVSGEAYSDTFSRAMEHWLELPADSAPTAVVIGAGTTAWHSIEMVLAEQGRRIGDQPGEIAVVGTGGQDLVLLAGEGYVFRHMAAQDMARAMVDRLLIPMLQEPGAAPEGSAENKETAVLLRPTLEPAARLNLLERGFRFARTPDAAWSGHPKTNAV